MKITKIISLVLLLFVLMSATLSVSAFEPYQAYTYDEFDKGIVAANGYEPKTVYYGDNENGVVLNSPQDIFIDENGMIYILNTGNGSVVILNNDFSFVREITSFKWADGTEVKIVEGRGLCVHKGLIYIADYEGMALVISDMFGNINNVITKPENPVFPQEKEFRPFSVVVDGRDNIYVLTLDIYQGAIVFTPDHKFKDYFGGNLITPTVSLLADRFWQSILSSEADEAFSNYVPVLPESMDITRDGFLYTCSKSSSYGESNVRCVTPAGAELFLCNGDYEIGVRKFQSQTTEFIDVAVSDSEYVYVIDSTRYRIFVFDKEQNLIFTFGANGSKKGTFYNPKAIDTYKNDAYVLDSSKGCIAVLTPTEYGNAVLEALRFYEDGKYEDSVEGWQQVLRMNGNEHLAYNGIGKALLYSGEYSEARQYFKRAANREDESRAFELYRNNFLRENALVIIILVIAFVAVIVAVSVTLKILKKRRNQA